MMIQALGIPSHYEQWGKADEDILLLHGWGKPVTLARHLAPIAPHLVQAGRVTALEFPAHGMSGKPGITWGVAEYADWTADMIGQLKLPPLTVVAHSFGARVALWLAVHRPHLVKRLVLTGAAGLRPPDTQGKQAARRLYQLQKQGLEGIKKLPGLGSLAQSLQRRLRDRHASPDYLDADEDMKATFVRIVSHDLGDLLPQVRQSTLLIWGEMDDATPLWMGRRMAQEMPDAALIVFEGRGHFAYLEEPARFGLIVRAFIAEDAKTVV